MTAVHACSLINKEPQEIEPETWQLLRFPFEGESYDKHGMHSADQPDGGQSCFPDERSGLIWPSRDGWGILEANIHWESCKAGDDWVPGLPDWMKDRSYREVRDQFVRDPLDLSSDEPGDEGAGGNTTATDHRAPSVGMQCFTKLHQLFVHPNVPLGLRVRHDGHKPVKVTHAQFKLAIFDFE